MTCLRKEGEINRCVCVFLVCFKIYALTRRDGFVCLQEGGGGGDLIPHLHLRTNDLSVESTINTTPRCSAPPSPQKVEGVTLNQRYRCHALVFFVPYPHLQTSDLPAMNTVVESTIQQRRGAPYSAPRHKLQKKQFPNQQTKQNPPQQKTISKQKTKTKTKRSHRTTKCNFQTNKTTTNP